MNDPYANPAASDRPTLAATLGFSEDDLAANAQGVLSEGQAVRLQRRAGCSLIGGSVLTLILAGVGFWLAGQGVWWLAALLFAGAGALFYFSRTGRGGPRAELAAGEVAHLHGEVILDTHDYATPNGHVTEYRVTVDGETFLVSRDAYAAFIDGNIYDVYVLPTSRIVLSARLAG